MTPTVAELRDDSAIMVLCAMPDPGSHRSAYAIAECHRLFDCCRSPHEALLIPALAIWSALTGGTVRCREDLPRFGRVGFLVQHSRFRCPLVLECDRVRRTVARDRALEAAGYAVRRLVIGDGKAGVTAELDAAFESVCARLH